MKKIKVNIYLKNIKKPFKFVYSKEKDYLDFLQVIDKTSDNELIMINNLVFIKKEFVYAITK